MSILSERNQIAGAPGYWAIQIHLGESTPARRYLCHAENDRAAVNMAGRLMGSSVEARGFDSLWIKKGLLERKRSSLPDIGRHQIVSSSAEWDRLVQAHNASEAESPLRA